MAFPSTRHSLIRRIAVDDSDDGWREFLEDYWGPICRFAARWGGLGAEDAEDVASATVEAIVRNELLDRWSRDPRSKLRTMLCTVVRNVIANRVRKAGRRQRLVDEHGGALDDYREDEATDEELDVFYAAWVDHVLRTAVDALLRDYHAEGRGDYFRVLYGRVCEGMTTREVADCLDLRTTDVENRYRHARDRLRGRLENHVRVLTAKYDTTDDAESRFEEEWRELGSWLERHGGLETVLRASAGSALHDELDRRSSASIARVLATTRQR